MPKKFLMNWQPDKARWRKMYKGRWFFVTPKELGCNSTKDASWKQANKWWTEKLASLTHVSIDKVNTMLLKILENGTSVKDAATSLSFKDNLCEQVLAYLSNHVSTDRIRFSGHSTTQTSYDLTIDQQKVLQPINPFNFQLILDPSRRVSPTEAPKTYVDKRTLTMALSQPSVDQNRSLIHHFEKWSALQLSSQKSAGRKKMNIHMLEFFKEYVGDGTVDQIDEIRWMGFYTWLNDKKSLGDNYKNRIFGTAKSFLRYLYELKLIELPRNLNSSYLVFKTTTKEVLVVTNDVLRRYYQAITGQTKLHFLLMLNCGMGAQDISDLKDTEVDWQLGTITRKRSKTKNHKNVPRVTYYLWPRCFQLLKHYRSGQPTVLLTKSGNFWIQKDINAGTYRYSNSIATNFKKFSQETNLKVCPAELRRTAASKLAQHEKFKFYAEYFLCHSTKSVADTHYVRPSETEFRAALEWLEQSFNLEGL